MNTNEIRATGENEYEYRGYTILGNQTTTFVCVAPYGAFAPKAYTTLDEAKAAIDKDIIAVNNIAVINDLCAENNLSYPYAYAMCRAMGDDNDNCNTCPLYKICLLDEEREEKAKELILNSEFKL